MNQTFLIPANSKKSLKIFGLFNPFDLILFSTGVGISLLLIMFVPLDSLTDSLLALFPGAVTGFLVFPVPNYHNVLTALISMITYFTTRQRYIWKGWCAHEEEKTEKK